MPSASVSHTDVLTWLELNTLLLLVRRFECTSQNFTLNVFESLNEHSYQNNFSVISPCILQFMGKASSVKLPATSLS